MFKNRSRSMIGGIVASPTPTIPISGDSITVMTVRVPGRARANMPAASQPAVPPPTIAMLVIRLSPAALEICWVSDIRDQTLVSTGESERLGSAGIAALPLPQPLLRLRLAPGLQLALYTEEQAPSHIVVREWLIGELQIGVHFFIRQVDNRHQDPEVRTKIVFQLAVQLPIRRLVDCVNLRRTVDVLECE